MPSSRWLAWSTANPFVQICIKQEMRGARPTSKERPDTNTSITLLLLDVTQGLSDKVRDHFEDLR
jgi:hypothetical protein